MPEGTRPEARYAAALVVMALIPACLNYSLVTLLFIPAIAAVLFLWFTRSYLLMAVSLAATLIAATILFGYVTGLLLMIGFAMPALTISLLMKRNHGLVRSGSAALLPPLLGLGLSYSTVREAMLLVTTEFNRAASDPRVAGLYSVADHDLLIRYVNWVSGAVITLLPALLLTMVAAIIFAGGILGIVLIRRQGMFIYGIEDFAMWKLPEWLLLPLAGSVILLLTDQSLLVAMGWNVLFLLYLLYSICGLSLTEYLMRRWKLTLPLKLLVYVVLFLTQIFAAVLLPLAALFDSHFDFRRVRAKLIG